MKSYLIRHLNRDKGATCTFPRGEFAILSITGQTTVVACDNGYSFEIYDLTEEIKSKIPTGLKAEDCKIKIHTWRFFDVEGKKQLVDISCKNLDVTKNKEKEKPVGKPPSLFTNDEVQEALHSGPEYADRFPKKGTTPGKNPSVNPSKSRGITPADTTAPNSRNTQTPVKKSFGGLSSDDLISGNRNNTNGLPSGKSVKSKIFEQTGAGKTTSAKQSLTKAAPTFGNSSIPKGLKANFSKSSVILPRWQASRNSRLQHEIRGPRYRRAAGPRHQEIRKRQRNQACAVVPQFQGNLGQKRV